MELPETAIATILYECPKSTRIFRIHNEQFDGNSFNPCNGFETRFTHLFDNNGDCVPTFYAITTLDGAAFETVFREIPNKYGVVQRQMLDDMVISTVSLKRALRLVPLFTPELKAWGLDQAQVFAPKTGVYDFCRKLAFRCWRDNPEADGLIWSSVRDSSAHGLLLFGDRLHSEELEIVSSRYVRTDSSALNDLESAGRRGGWFISKPY